MIKRSAFTLIELMVVVAIIGLLMAILLPSLQRAKASSRRAACASNLRQIAVVLRIYIGERRDRLPYASYLPSQCPLPLDADEAVSISDVLAKHLDGDIAIFQCPADLSGGAREPPNYGKSYFQSERSSYEYRVRLGGRTTDEFAAMINARSDRIVSPDTIWILRDHANFHGKGGAPGARRYLYMDGHVGDFEN